MKKLNVIQQMMLDTGMLKIKLPVKHLTSDYDEELIINADSCCDLCQTKYPEWNVHSVGDLTVCEGCYEHYND